jgi:4-diphosphocytidyl-2-C-methyl-D-erythritol kinase
MGDAGARTVAQAKVNLLLSVGELLPTGYHAVRTLFQRIDLGDDVLVRATRSATRSIVCRGMDVGPPADNLAFRAAALFATTTGWPNGFEIEIGKKVPVGSGLGGGSADAAAVLRILNHLAPQPLDRGTLVELAARLGSDVPFLASPSCLAFAEGRGELLLQLSPLPPRGITLFTMPFGVSTVEAYGWLDEDRASRPARKWDEWNRPPVDSWDDVARVSGNDFEEAVSDRFPDLAVLLATVRSADFELAEMSGSGSTVFAVSFDENAERVDGDLPEGIEQILTRTANEVAPVEVLD